MPWTHNDILDGGLIAAVNRIKTLHFCSQYPLTYADAVGAYSLGNRVAPIVVGPEPRPGGGRRVRIPAFSNGVPTVGGIPAYIVGVDPTTSQRIVIWEALDSINTPIVLGQAISLMQDLTLDQPAYEDAG